VTFGPKLGTCVLSGFKYKIGGKHATIYSWSTFKIMMGDQLSDHISSTFYFGGYTWRFSNFIIIWQSCFNVMLKRIFNFKGYFKVFEMVGVVLCSFIALF
jgi:hypothetical protein